MSSSGYTNAVSLLLPSRPHARRARIAGGPAEPMPDLRQRVHPALSTWHGGTGYGATRLASGPWCAAWLWAAARRIWTTRLSAAAARRLSERWRGFGAISVRRSTGRRSRALVARPGASRTGLSQCCRRTTYRRARDSKFRLSRCPDTCCASGGQCFGSTRPSCGFNRNERRSTRRAVNGGTVRRCSDRRTGRTDPARGSADRAHSLSAGSRTTDADGHGQPRRAMPDLRRPVSPSL